MGPALHLKAWEGSLLCTRVGHLSYSASEQSRALVLLCIWPEQTRALFLLCIWPEWSKQGTCLTLHQGRALACPNSLRVFSKGKCGCGSILGETTTSVLKFLTRLHVWSGAVRCLETFLPVLALGILICHILMAVGL